jgi:hypothetical protein
MSALLKCSYESKRLPPYGRELLKMRQQGLAPAGPYVVISLDSWRWGRAYARVVIPPDLDPEDVNFAFVAGLDVVLVLDRGTTTPLRRDAAVKQLLACNPASLRVLEIDRPIRWTWIKSRRHGVELPEYFS